MGVEYTLQFAHPDSASVATALRQLPMVREVSVHEGTFELRAAENTGAIPDGAACLDPEGLYFCDYGGAGQQFLGVVIARLVSDFGPVTVVERE